MGRAIELITAYCAAISHEGEDEDDIDPEAGEAFFDMLYDLEQPLVCASSLQEEDQARENFSMTIIGLVSIVNHLLDHCDSELGKFDLISGIAQSHYRSQA